MSTKEQERKKIAENLFPDWEWDAYGNGMFRLSKRTAEHCITYKYFNPYENEADNHKLLIDLIRLCHEKQLVIVTRKGIMRIFKDFDDNGKLGKQVFGQTAMMSVMDAVCDAWLKVNEG